jgi:hypothetical protein
VLESIDTSVITTNELSSNDISTNNIFIESGIINYKSGDSNVTLNLADGIANVETIVVTKIYENIEELFNADHSKDGIGTTYIVKNGSSEIKTPETFVLSKNENDEKELIPTSSYIISSNTPDETYNYSKGNILWIDKSYTNGNKNDIDDITSGELKEDNTLVTSNDYKLLKNAIDKLYYILGIDMDAGSVEDSSNSEGEGVDAGEFNNETETTRSNYGLILTDLKNNQKNLVQLFEKME